MTNQEYANGLRMLADWYEGHPEAPQPYESHLLTFNTGSREGVQRVLQAFGGSWDKEAASGLMYFRSTFGPFKLKMYIGQEAVCTRRLVGVKTLPARPAEPEREVPVYEWDCRSILESGQG